MLKYGAFERQGNIFQKIKNETTKSSDPNGIEVEYKPLGHYEEVEIKLRICKLVGIFDLSCYEGKQFKSLEEIEGEAGRNRKRHEDGLFDKKVQIKGGVVFNPRPEDLPQDLKSNLINSFFRKPKLEGQQWVQRQQNKVAIKCRVYIS